MRDQVGVIGVGMTPMNRRDVDPGGMATEAVRSALADADLPSSDIGLVVVGNAMGGRLNGQGCIRGQTWLRGLDLHEAGVINVDNSCAGGSSAMHVGVMAASAGESPVLVVGVEKMWVGDRRRQRWPGSLTPSLRTSDGHSRPSSAAGASSWSRMPIGPVTSWPSAVQLATRSPPRRSRAVAWARQILWHSSRPR